MSYTLNVAEDIVRDAERCAVRRGTSLADMLRAYMIVIVQDDAAKRYLQGGRAERRGMRLGVAEGRFRVPSGDEDRAMDEEIEKMFSESADEVSA